MSFTDHKISAFTHKITDLPDQPNMPSDELKARFDSSPEELRQAHNALCDDAQTLDAKVDSIINETFDGVIEKSMFSDALTEEFDAKVSQTVLGEQTNALRNAIDTEITARKNADNSLSSQISTVKNTAAKKCEVILGSYTGNCDPNDSGSQFINLGYTPRAVIVFNEEGQIANSGYTYGGIATSITDDALGVRLESNGFRVYQQGFIIDVNQQGQTYGYLVFK